MSLLPFSPGNARVLYLDMNSFFASVEQQYNPPYQNKPLAVVSHLAPRATVLAASIEAKRFGIRTGTKLTDAQHLCPEIIFTETHPILYRSVHDRFLLILQNLHGVNLQAKSIDEAAIYLESNYQNSEFAHTLAQKIKQTFKEEIGESIRCSIGIAPNTSLAKLATDLRKPDGLLEITLEDLPTLLSQISHTDLAGISTRSAAHLLHKNLHTPVDIYHQDPQQLFAWFGSWGYHWWWRLHGYEIDAEPKSHYKSISHQHVLQKWQHQKSEITPTIVRMTDRLIHRLRRNQLQCQKISLSVKLINAHSLYFEEKFDSPTASYSEIMISLQNFLDHIPTSLPGSARKISLSFNGLLSAQLGLQLDLQEKAPTREALSLAVEDIRQRYGFAALQRGSSLEATAQSAKEQIGFGRIRDTNSDELSSSVFP